MTFIITVVHVLGLFILAFGVLLIISLCALSAAIDQLNKVKQECKVAEDKRITAELREHASESAFESLQKSYSQTCDENYRLKVRLNLIRELADTNMTIKATLEEFTSKESQ